MSVKNIKKNKGFTLLETLMAVLILGVTIVGPIEYSRSGLVNSLIARDELVAHGLIQDAIESVRNIKDSNTKSSRYWLQNLSNCIGKTCLIDTSRSAISITACGSSCPNLRENEVSGVKYYGYDSAWVDSKFKREVRITTKSIPATEKDGTLVMADNEAVVTVTIKWKPSTLMKERTLTVEEHVFNWASEI